MKKLMLTLMLVLFTSASYANPVDSISTWLSNEKTKTIEFQKKNWNKMKNDLHKLMQKIGLKKGDK